MSHPGAEVSLAMNDIVWGIEQIQQIQITNTNTNNKYKYKYKYTRIWQHSFELS